jgi:hypothetical protein
MLDNDGTRAHVSQTLAIEHVVIGAAASVCGNLELHFFLLLPEDRMEEGVKFDDFINPKSMITPGAAGAITMAITNVLTSEFAPMPANWTALIVSFLFGALTFLYAAQLFARLIYFIINSLIIFVMAHGANAIGISATKPANTAPTAEWHIRQSARVLGERSVTLASITNDQARGMAFTVSKDGILKLVQASAPDKAVVDDKKKGSGFFKEWGW